MQTNDIPLELKETFQRELKPGERVLWSEMPIPTFYAQKHAIVDLQYRVDIICCFMDRRRSGLLGSRLQRRFRSISAYEGFVSALRLTICFDRIGHVNNPLFQLPQRM